MVNGNNHKPRIMQIFANMGNAKFPEFSPPEKKSVKDLKIQLEQDRARRIEEHRKRFEESEKQKVNFISDEEFMRRGDPIDEEAEKEKKKDKFVCCYNIFKEDMDSYNLLPSSTAVSSSSSTSTSQFERLHRPRKKVIWSAETMEDFKQKGKLLDKALSVKRIKRSANIDKRIAKNERANLELKRLTAAEAKEKAESTDPDVTSNIFGFLNLLPIALRKAKTGDEGEKAPAMTSAFRRKQQTALVFVDYLYDFNYKKREKPEKAAKKEYHRLDNLLKQRMKELEEEEASYQKFRKEVEAQESRRKDDDAVASGPSPISEESSSRKRKSDDADGDGPVVVSTTASVSVNHEEMIRGFREIAKKVSQEKIPTPDEEEAERERQREKERARERERKRKCLEAHAEARKIKERKEQEQKRQAQQQEELRKMREEEEENRKLYEEQERARKLEEDRQVAVAKRLEKERMDGEALEELKRNINEKKRQVDIEEKLSSVDYSAVLPNDSDKWKLFNIKTPFTNKKDAYFKSRGYSTREEARSVERETRRKSFEKDKPLVMPQEDTIITKVINSSMPKPKPVVKRPPKVIPAPESLIRKLSGSLKDMMSNRKGPIGVKINLKEKEVSYANVSAEALKNSYVYPFQIAAGMYFPVFCVLSKEDSISAHVEGITTCNSFSGKFASHLLLTTAREEEEPEAKFEKSYADSDGDYLTYSQKPGRFSNRQGFRQHLSSTQMSMEEQRARARDNRRRDWEKETREFDDFRQAEEDYRRNKDHEKNTYAKKLQTHLQAMVNDARLDVYSRRETFDISGIIGHPGTRVASNPNRWCNHGYHQFKHNRSAAYAEMMYDRCEKYEDELPRSDQASFEQWALVPMLASIHYQATYNPFATFSSNKMKALEERRNKYLNMIKAKTFSLKHVTELCKLTDTDKEQWTFLMDQLASHFKDFPAVFSLMDAPDSALRNAVHTAINQLMNTLYKNRSNHWDLQVHPNRSNRNY